MHSAVFLESVKEGFVDLCCVGVAAGGWFPTWFYVTNQKLGFQVELEFAFTNPSQLGFLILIGFLKLVGPKLVAFLHLLFFCFCGSIDANQISFSSPNSVSTP